MFHQICFKIINIRLEYLKPYDNVFLIYYYYFPFNFTKIVFFFLHISSEEINKKSLKWQIYQTLKRGQTVGTCMAGVSVTKAAELFGVARSIVLKVMTAFEKEGKCCPLKPSTGRNQKLPNRDRLTLTMIVKEDHKNTVLKITADLNDDLENPISSKTLWRELHKAGLHRRAAIRKPY